MAFSDNHINIARVGECLGITPAGVRRLVRDGHLEVKDTRRYKFGEEFYFDPLEVENLLPRMPEFKRKWQSEEDIRMGAKRAAFKRVEAGKRARCYRDVKEQFLRSLESYPEKAAILLRASFFLYHLNHYAKGGEEYLYDLKEKVLKEFLFEFSPAEGLDVFFIEGGQKVYLCDSCRSKAQNRGMDYGRYKAAFGGCPQCKKERDYYSLFEFRVDYGEHHFCFHTPYHTAKKWFENPKELPCKTREGGKEEARPFGRTISEAEARAVALEEVVRELEFFMEGRE